MKNQSNTAAETPVKEPTFWDLCENPDRGCDSVADLRQEYNQLKEINSELVEALKRSLPELKEFLNADPECDHSVGICVCGLIRTIELAESAISKATGERE